MSVNTNQRSSNYKVPVSKFLSYTLRHNPPESMTEDGYVAVSELLDMVNQPNPQTGKRRYGLTTDLSYEDLADLVATNNKKRFAFDETSKFLRASQGHSIQVDLGMEPITPPKVLYHGTADRFVASIIKTGLDKRNRQHVHLSGDIETATNVGQRHGRPIILQVDCEQMLVDGFKFYQSANGVWLTDHVPAKYLSQQE